MQKHILIVIITISFLITPKHVFSQLSYETSKAMMIFQFAQNISHESYVNIDKYKICFLGDDVKTFQELGKIAKNNKINEKTVEFFFANDLSNVPDVQLLYIDKTWSDRIDEVWYMIENKNTLLVSEQCSDGKYVMLNILYDEDENQISYEANKANLIIEEFIINPELIISGDNEIDIRELFREMKQQLEVEKQKVERHKQIIEKQTVDLLNLREQTDSLNTNVTLLLEKISISEGKLNYLMDSVKAQQDVLLMKLVQIESQEVKLENQKNEIGRKENEIIERTKELNVIIDEKNKQQVIIDEQKNILSDQKDTISAKSRQLFLFYALAFVLLIVILLILLAYTIRKKAIKKQQIANEKLENQKNILEKTLQKLTETQTQLVQSEKMASLGVLTAGIAHEINNPVNYINSGLEGLKSISAQIIETVSEYDKINNENNKSTKEEVKKELNFLTEGIATLTKNIQTGVNRTTEIIRGLNTFSRVDNDDLSLTNIHENLDLTISLLRNQYKNRIEIIKKYGEIPKTLAYSGKLNQVFMNIISNAIQSIKDKGTVTISTLFIENSLEVEGNCIKIVIEDTGAGIPKEIKDRIFEPFFTTKQVGKGTGLGLSISHGIIEQHNGKILLTSEKRIGTKFEIFLPVLVESKN